MQFVWAPHYQEVTGARRHTEKMEMHTGEMAYPLVWPNWPCIQTPEGHDNTHRTCCNWAPQLGRHTAGSRAPQKGHHMGSSVGRVLLQQLRVKACKHTVWHKSKIDGEHSNMPKPSLAHQARELQHASTNIKDDAPEHAKAKLCPKSTSCAPTDAWQTKCLIADKTPKQQCPQVDKICLPR